MLSGEQFTEGVREKNKRENFRRGEVWSCGTMYINIGWMRGCNGYRHWANGNCPRGGMRAGFSARLPGETATGNDVSDRMIVVKVVDRAGESAASCTGLESPAST